MKAREGQKCTRRPRVEALPGDGFSNAEEYDHVIGGMEGGGGMLQYRDVRGVVRG